MSRYTNLGRLAAIGAVSALLGCDSSAPVIGPTVVSGGATFQSYVALGNSITAGFQSGGIVDSTQRQSYARLLAQAMGTQYHYASLAAPGCTPPLASFTTGAYYQGAAAGACGFRTGTSVTDVLNNVAVPGARSLDPTSQSTVASNALTTFILGGLTQVQKALQAKPTFATIWIGNNDVLEAGASGVLVSGTPYSPGIVSTQAQFQANYDLMITQLLAGAPNLKGVLIGVVQVGGIPLLSAGGSIASSAATQAAINAATGKTVAINANCTGSTALIDLPKLLPFIKAGTFPAAIVCAKGTAPFPDPIGDVFVLDPTEQTTLAATVSGYNTYIQAKAAAIGFAYYDPNTLFASLRAAGSIPALPNFTSATLPFGTLFSLDGVHPSGAGQLLIANDLINAINAKYGTKLPLQVSQ